MNCRIKRRRKKGKNIVVTRNFETLKNRTVTVNDPDQVQFSGYPDDWRLLDYSNAEGKITSVITEKGADKDKLCILFGEKDGFKLKILPTDPRIEIKGFHEKLSDTFVVSRQDHTKEFKNTIKVSMCCTETKSGEVVLHVGYKEGDENAVEEIFKLKDVDKTKMKALKNYLPTFTVPTWWSKGAKAKILQANNPKMIGRTVTIIRELGDKVQIDQKMPRVDSTYRKISLDHCPPNDSVKRWNLSRIY